MRGATLLLLIVLPIFASPPGSVQMNKASPKTESVMSPGMTITATTSVGTMMITAVNQLTRSYTWEGATRSVEMWPRPERWNGSLGLYFPGPGDHWEPHTGISRAVVEEGQQHFKTLKQALDWIHALGWMPCLYRDDG